MTILKLIWKDTDFQISTTILKKNKVGRITQPNIKTYGIAIYNQNNVVWEEDRFLDQCDGIENLEKDPYQYVQLIFDRYLIMQSNSKEERQPFHQPILEQINTNEVGEEALT